MNHLLNVTKKELKELMTPGTIASILVIVIMLSAIGSMMSANEESTSAPQKIGIVYDGDISDVIFKSGENVATVESMVIAAYMSLYGTDVDPSKFITYLDAAYGDDKAIIDEMGSKHLSVTVTIPISIADNIENKQRTVMSSYYIYKDGGLTSTVTSAYGSTLVSYMTSYLTTLLVYDMTGDDKETAFVESPLGNISHTSINGEIYEKVTPYEIFSSMMGQKMMVPIIVMIVIVMVGSIVISSMGSEKENKTLETLLTMPIRRTTIVSGKLLSAAIMGLVYGVCYLFGMMFYSNGLTSGIGSTVDLGKYGLAMSPTDWIILMVLMFLSIFSALGICMILGAFTKNYKMAQTMTMPISGLAILPMLVFMFSSWDSLPGIIQGLMFAIPFTHPMMGMDNLMY
ncbi:MAG: ABC transporter permease, partial [archaeon]|nr:ABC transporter permease [archaeon]